MTTQITELRTAEDSHTAAQERLAKLYGIRRQIMGAMERAGYATARELLTDDELKLFGYEGLSDKAEQAAELGMDDLVTQASDEAGAASMFLHEMESEQFDASHPEPFVRTFQEAAE